MSACKVEVKDYICTVTIDRPPANATSKATYDEIRDTFYALDRREDIKVVILTGAGKIFMAGNELSEFGEFYEPSKCTEHYDRIRNAYLAVKNCRKARRSCAKWSWRACRARMRPAAPQQSWRRTPALPPRVSRRETWSCGRGTACRRAGPSAPAP